MNVGLNHSDTISIQHAALGAEKKFQKSLNLNASLVDAKSSWPMQDSCILPICMYVHHTKHIFSIRSSFCTVSERSICFFPKIIQQNK